MRLPLSHTHPLAAADGSSRDTSASRLVRALRGDRPDVTPVWFMRQAGRSLPEYRALRAAGGTMLEACLDPATASEITLQPVRRHGVDAAVFFSDIVVPLRLVGVDVEIAAGRGPVFPEPVRTAADVARLVRIDPALVEERGEAVVEAVQRTTAMLAEEGERRGEALPLIGFAGAPFTLAAYLVEGGPSKDHLGARSLIHSDPAAWHDLTRWLAEVTGRFLALQVRAGASAAQLFDSWGGRWRPPTTGAPCCRHPLPPSSPCAHWRPMGRGRLPCRSSTSASAQGRSSRTWPRSAWMRWASTTACRWMSRPLASERL